MSRCATALAASDVSDVKATTCGVYLHEVVKLRPLAGDQELGRGIVKARALQLPDRRAQFEDFGTKL
jgi:hypothetical protein